MRFKDDSHKKRFMGSIRKMDRSNNTQMSLVFLLTADRLLWNRCKIYMVDNKIPIHRVRLKRVKEEAYVLFCSAKDIALGTTHLSMNDLVDKDVVSGQVWKLIFTALEIKRYGVGMIVPYTQNKKGAESDERVDKKAATGKALYQE